MPLFCLILAVVSFISSNLSFTLVLRTQEASYVICLCSQRILQPLSGTALVIFTSSASRNGLHTLGNVTAMHMTVTCMSHHMIVVAFGLELP